MKYLIVVLALLSSGCTIMGWGSVKDVDTEKEEVKRLREMKKKTEADGYVATPPIVKTADKDDVYIVVEKSMPITEHDYSRDVWHVFAENKNAQPKCVYVVWRLLDFEYISDEPAEFFITGKTRRPVGTMLQHVYTIDGVRFTAPASGYVHAMTVREPNKKARRGEECVVEDKNVKTK